MSHSVSLALDAIHCIKQQELKSDEIIVWGAMVCNNDLFMVTAEIPERKFQSGTTKFLLDQPVLMTIPFDERDIATGLTARAALWIVERDDWIQTLQGGSWLWSNNGNEAYRKFHTLYNERLKQLGRGNGVQAFKDILPKMHKFIVDSTSGWFIDDDEVFPYINVEYRRANIPVMRSGVSDTVIEGKKAHGAEYSLQLHWVLEMEGR